MRLPFVKGQAVDILERLDEEEELKLEHILRDLLNTDNVDVKTEIRQPYAISMLDVLAEYYDERFSAKAGVGKALRLFLLRYRINMVSFERKREGAIIKGLQTLNQNRDDKHKGVLERDRQQNL